MQRSAAKRPTPLREAFATAEARSGPTLRAEGAVPTSQAMHACSRGRTSVRGHACRRACVGMQACVCGHACVRVWACMRASVGILAIERANP
eukprot:4108171-Pleurochrysis_carterae.AAC.1